MSRVIGGMRLAPLGHSGLESQAALRLVIHGTFNGNTWHATGSSRPFGPLKVRFAKRSELPSARHRWNVSMLTLKVRFASLREANFRVRGIVGTAAVPPCPVTLRAL